MPGKELTLLGIGARFRSCDQRRAGVIQDSDFSKLSTLQVEPVPTLKPEPQSGTWAQESEGTGLEI